jgi:hypothetical protein
LLKTNYCSAYKYKLCITSNESVLTLFIYSFINSYFFLIFFLSACVCALVCVCWCVCVCVFISVCLFVYFITYLLSYYFSLLCPALPRPHSTPLHSTPLKRLWKSDITCLPFYAYWYEKHKICLDVMWKFACFCLYQHFECSLGDWRGKHLW